MKQYTKKSFFVLSLLVFSPIIAMKQEKNFLLLPLRNHLNDFGKPIKQQPKKYLPIRDLEDQKEINIIIYYAMIPEGELKCAPTLNFPIQYATQSVHTELNLPTTIADPVMLLNIVDEHFNLKFKKAIPLKHTFNLNDGSLLMTVKRDGSRLYPKNPLLKDEQFVIKIICVNNPKLEKIGKSFAQQKWIAKKQFYKDISKSIWIDKKDNAQKLIKAGIIKKTGTSSICYTVGNRLEKKESDIFDHGPNGCSNEPKLKQSMLDEKIPLLRQGFEGQARHTSYFKALKNRELTGSFRK